MTIKLIAALHVPLLFLSVAPDTRGADIPEERAENALVTLREHPGGVNRLAGLAVSPDNSLLATIDVAHRNVELWDLKTNRRIGRLVGRKPHDYVYSYSALPFDSRGKMLAVGAGDEVTVWDIPATLARLDRAGD